MGYRSKQNKHNWSNWNKHYNKTWAVKDGGLITNVIYKPTADV